MRFEAENDKGASKGKGENGQAEADRNRNPPEYAPSMPPAGQPQASRGPWRRSSERPCCRRGPRRL